MKQTSKIMKDTASAVNWIMGNNNTTPEVGKGATMLSWTDRTAYEVISVSKDKKRVVVKRYQAERTDKNGMSDDQTYKYEKFEGSEIVIVWRHNKCKRESNVIKFTEEYAKTIGPNFWDSEDHKQLYPNNSQFPILIPGKTEMVKEYSTVKIVWGIKDAFHDYTF